MKPNITFGLKIFRCKADDLIYPIILCLYYDQNFGATANMDLWVYRMGDSLSFLFQLQQFIRQ